MDWTEYAHVITDLIVGGAIAAPISPWLSQRLPKRVVMIAVALLAISLARNALQGLEDFKFHRCFL